MKNSQRICWVLCFLVQACTQKNTSTQQLGIEIQPSQTSLIIKNLPPELLENSTKDSMEWSTLFSVYPANTNEELHKALKGTYTPSNNQLLFKPIEPFKKGKTYYLEIYIQNRALNLSALLQKRQQMNRNEPIVFKFSY